MSPAEDRAILPATNSSVKVEQVVEDGWNAPVIKAYEDTGGRSVLETNEIVVVKFTESAQQAWFVGRSVNFPRGKRPTRNNVINDLITKFVWGGVDRRISVVRKSRG